MNNSRRKFLKSISLIAIAVSLPIKTSAYNLFEKSTDFINKSLEKVIAIISSLKKESSSIVKKSDGWKGI